MGSRWLVHQAYAASTRIKYGKCVDDFVSWCHATGIRIVSTTDMDETLCDYIFYLFEESLGRSKAVATVYGIVALFPAWRRSFPTALMSLKGWARIAPTISHPPLSWDLCVLVAWELVRRGYPCYALGVLLSFDCLLRINELLALTFEDVSLPGDLRLSGARPAQVLIRLKHTKTGKNQWVQVRHPFIIEWLSRHLASSRSGERLFPYEACFARCLFKSTAGQLGLPPSIVPHSLRHGGATALHLSGESMEDILLRGRWASSKSARVYIH